MSFAGNISPDTEAVDLRLAQWPDFHHLVRRHTDDWVLEYEQTIAVRARQNRRKGELQQGVFYTPPSVARYLVERSLGQRLGGLLARMQAAGDASRPAVAVTVWEEAQRFRIVDPACGTGIFLVEALRTLVAFYRTLALQITKMKVDIPEEMAIYLAQPACYAVTRQLYGMDVDPLAVAIAEARLAQWAQQLNGDPAFIRQFDACSKEGKTLSWAIASSHWYEGDTLSAPRGFFPDAPDWTFILGNPPYVSEVRKQAARFRTLQQTDASRYYRAKMDLCDAFLAWSAEHTQPGGQLAYVLPEYWTQRSGAASVREKLWKQGRIREFRIFPETPLFADAPGHHSALLVWERHEGTGVEKADQAPSAIGSYTANFAAGGDAANLQAASLRPALFWLHPASGKLLYGEPAAIGLLERFSHCPPLFAAGSIAQGIVMPQGRIRSDGRRARGEPGKKESGVFLLTREELEALNLNERELALIKPYYLPGRFKAFAGFHRFYFTPPDYYLIYGDVDNRRRLGEEPTVYARLRTHLERFSELNTSDFAPYGLHRPRQTSCFEGKTRIFGLRQTSAPCFAVLEEPAYVNESFYIVHHSEIDPWCAVALLNSDLGHFWFYHQKRKGYRLQIDKDVLAFFPAPPKMTEALSVDLAELSRRLSRINPVASASSADSSQSEERRALNTLVNIAYGLNAADEATVKHPFSL